MAKVKKNNRAEYIYRVEDQQGLGPYVGKFNYELEFMMYYDDPRTPYFYDDSILSKAFNNKADLAPWRCCFKSLEQYQEWFDRNDHRDILYKNGLLLVKYKCPTKTVIHGATQSIFKQERAKPVAVGLCNEVDMVDLGEGQSVVELANHLRANYTQRNPEPVKKKKWWQKVFS